MATKIELVDIAKSMGLEIDEMMTKAEIQALIDANIDTTPATPEEIVDVPTWPEVKVIEEEVIPQVPKKQSLSRSQERIMSHQDVKNY